MHEDKLLCVMRTLGAVKLLINLICDEKTKFKSYSYFRIAKVFQIVILVLLFQICASMVLMIHNYLCTDSNVIS